MTVKAVCWDWNGTLLDDVARCLRVMNLMLADFGRPTITDVAAYRAVFRFPLNRFYADVGIEPADYRAAVDRYPELLAADTTDMAMHTGAREALERVQARGIAQVLASATLAPLLDAQLRPHRLSGSFDDILSITDAHHASKQSVIETWLWATGYEPADVLLIGDTNHDLEIAREFGTRFVHFDGGHQALSGGRDVVSIRALAELEPLLGE